MNPLTATSSRIAREMLETLDTMNDWRQWLEAPECFLPEVERSILVGYVSGQTPLELARTYKSSTGGMEAILRRINRKLKDGRNLFEYWRTGSLQPEAHRWTKDPQTAYFLETPFSILPLTTRLMHGLSNHGGNFNELLDYLHQYGFTVAQLRGVGPDSALYVKALFLLHNCDDLLGPRLGITDCGQVIDLAVLESHAVQA